jgi:peptidyl-prolyl cis-trans isomerase B (cyclophilin B)
MKPPLTIVAAVVVALAGVGEVRGQVAPKQAVVETAAGTFVIDLTPDAAPNQVAYFTKLAQEVQGGDPLTKDPSKRSLYGTGGLNAIKAEARAPKMTRGSVAAVLVPGRPDSAGSQFFIVLADQPTLDGQFTVFGQVVEGLDVLQKISEAPMDDKGLATDRIEIRRVAIRDKPPPVPEPFSTETAAELTSYRAVLDTSAGSITLELFPDRAPTHVRQFLRLAQAGVYDGTAFHRVVPGFIVQTGALNSRTTPLTDRQQKIVQSLQPEFNDTKHVKGIVSMARGTDPASATTSFFICTGTSPELDGVYTVFARVVSGLSVVEAIEASPVDGETPRTRIELKSVRVERAP